MEILKNLGTPADTAALLWDMDGVLIDSLTFDVVNCSRILQQATGTECHFSRETIRDGFALSPDDFWRYLARHANLPIAENQLHDLIERYEEERRAQAFPLLPGVIALLEKGREAGLKMAVVSNNPKADVDRILRNCGLFDRFDAVFGNDRGNLRKKPFPDTYLDAADRLGVSIADCIVIEDSLIGAEAGFSAGAFTIGVASGGADLVSLQNSGFCSVGFESLANLSLDDA